MTAPLHTLRLAVLIVLMLALLPWGAYARSPAVSSNHATAQPDKAAVEIIVSNPEKSEPVAMASRHCRGPALMGSACSPDLGLASLHKLVSVSLHAIPERPSGPLRLSSRNVAVLTGPPRVN
jgi:hypothetical protein